LKTTAATAEKVGQEYSKDMKMLVKYGQLPNITEPVAPENRPNAVEMKRWEAKLESHKARVQKICRQVYGVWPYLFEVLQSDPEELGTGRRLRKDARMEMEDDVVGLLAKLKVLAFSTEGTKHPLLVVQQSMRSMINVNQSPMEGVAN
jgi:hypothetical protein